jgi:heat shock protein HslJ
MIVRRRPDALAPIAAVFLIAAVAVAATPPPKPPTLKALQNATYRGIYEKPVTVKNGVYLGPPTEPGGASRPRIELVQDGVAWGDLEGNGTVDAAVLLAESSGGSGTMGYLAAVAMLGGHAINIGTAPVGDRVQVRSFGIEGGAIVMRLVEHAPEDPMCCPTLNVTKTWRCRGDSLVLTSSKEEGRVSIRDLEGPVWRMTLLDRNNPVPKKATVTAVFADGKISGTSGCNRYSASVQSADASEQMRVGPIAATRMACPDPIGSFEGRFLAALEDAQSFGFMVGKLVLTTKVEDRVGTMVFVSDSTGAR